MKVPSLSNEQANQLISACYDKALNGIPGSKSCTDLANEYLDKYADVHLAAKRFIVAQITKCTTSGFVTSLGGAITLPVAIPANLASVLYVQMRMIATIAAMGGFDPRDDEVQTLIYACLTGVSIADICKTAGIKAANSSAKVLVGKIPGSLIKTINAKMGYRFMTKAGNTGVINLMKAVPAAGGFVGGGVDFVSTRAIAKRACEVFLD